MIQRIWHGYTTPENAEAYETLLKNEIMPGIAAKQIPGYLGMQILRRVSEEHPGEIEFITIMKFSKLEDIKGFVGEDYSVANLPAIPPQLPFPSPQKTFVARLHLCSIGGSFYF